MWVGGREARGTVEAEEENIQLQRVAAKSAARAARACLRLNRCEEREGGGEGRRGVGEGYVRRVCLHVRSARLLAPASASLGVGGEGRVRERSVFVCEERVCERAYARAWE